MPQNGEDCESAHTLVRNDLGYARLNADYFGLKNIKPDKLPPAGLGSVFEVPQSPLQIVRKVCGLRPETWGAMSVEETSALFKKKKTPPQQAWRAATAAAAAAAQQSEATAGTKVAAAAAARSRTAAKFTHSATEEGKSMFGYSLGY